MNAPMVILAGGLGTRLKKSIGDLPKPMADIGGVPFLDYLLRRCKAQGVADFILCLGYGGEYIRSFFGQGERLGVSIRYTVEKSLLGTGGAVKLAEPLIQGDFFLANGDTYFEMDLKKMTGLHRQRGARATMALARREVTTRYGRVEIDGEGRVLTLDEKSEDRGAGYINAGLYLLGREVLGLIPPRRVCSLEREILPRLAGHGLVGLPADGYFIDIGIPEDYARAQRELPARRPT